MPLSLSEITKGLETSVQAVESKKKALDESKAQTAKVEAEYQDALSKVQQFHAAYTEHMEVVLSGFGTIHR